MLDATGRGTGALHLPISAIALLVAIATTASPRLASSCVEIAEVKLTGPSAGTAGSPLVFVASVTPSTASAPVIYTWQATGQPAVIIHSDRGVSDSIELVWTTEGEETLSVTAANECGIISSSLLTLTLTPPPPPCTAVGKVTIEGPSTGTPGSTIGVTARIEPAGVTMPITYSWTATGYPLPLVHASEQKSDTAEFTWRDGGSHAISIAATNECGTTATASFTVAIEKPPVVCPTSLGLSGRPTAEVGLPCTFTAAVAPPGTTSPVTYTWKASGQPSAVVHPDQGPTDSLTIVWDQPGPYTITAAAVNECGVVVTRTSTVMIEAPEAPCAGLNELALSGPTTGVMGIDYAFTATVGPYDATPPITYNWKADGHPEPVVHVDPNITDTVSFSWAEPGKYGVVVTAVNDCGAVVRGETGIAIEGIPCIAVEGIKIAGPVSGSADTPYTFVATVSPSNARIPITFTWQMPGEMLPVVHSKKEGFDTASASWDRPGEYVISVKAANGCGREVSTSHTLVIHDRS